jgi:hypothetical protein
MESNSCFFEPSRSMRSRVTGLYRAMDAIHRDTAAAKKGDAAAQSRLVWRVPRSADVFNPS